MIMHGSLLLFLTTNLQNPAQIFKLIVRQFILNRICFVHSKTSRPSLTLSLIARMGTREICCLIPRVVNLQSSWQENFCR